jgi:hypothetical protein
MLRIQGGCIGISPPDFICRYVDSCMLGGALHPPISTRRVLLFAIAVALVLPPPARCARCTGGAANCSHCAAATTEPAPAPAAHACCHDRITQPTATDSLAGCHQDEVGKCNCNLRPIDRTGLSVERQSIAPELVATLPSVPPILATIANATESDLVSNADLPPPLPHRVLHCSWII